MSSKDIANNMDKVVNQTAKVEMATLEDLPALTELVVELFSMSSGDFMPDVTGAWLAIDTGAAQPRADCSDPE
jgi:hypothetical protein